MSARELDRGPVIVTAHPLAAAALTVLRDTRSSIVEFRAAARALARTLIHEATRHLPTEVLEIETPITTAAGCRLHGAVVAIPILRAGLVMLDPFLEVVPTASTGFIGLRRDETTLMPTEYYRNVPPTDGSHVFLLDPMLATGGSVVAALDALDTMAMASVSLVCFIAAPEGVERIREAQPRLRILTASVDERLDGSGYIVPGLGDAGDRLCGTLP